MNDTKTNSLNPGHFLVLGSCLSCFKHQSRFIDGEDKMKYLLLEQDLNPEYYDLACEPMIPLDFDTSFGHLSLDIFKDIELRSQSAQTLTNARLYCPKATKASLKKFWRIFKFHVEPNDKRLEKEITGDLTDSTFSVTSTADPGATFTHSIVSFPSARTTCSTLTLNSCLSTKAPLISQKHYNAYYKEILDLKIIASSVGSIYIYNSNSSKKPKHSESINKSKQLVEWTGLDGVKDGFESILLIWNQDSPKWKRISRRGYAFDYDTMTGKTELRAWGSSTEKRTESLSLNESEPKWKNSGNLLKDGTLIYINGVLILWHSYNTLKMEKKQLRPNFVINAFQTSLTCPVTLEPIETQYIQTRIAKHSNSHSCTCSIDTVKIPAPRDANEQAIAVPANVMLENHINDFIHSDTGLERSNWARRFGSSRQIMGKIQNSFKRLLIFSPNGIFKKGYLKSMIESFKQRPWYFSECGHVYSYNSAFSGYSLCPTCRQEGFFRPLSLTPTIQLHTLFPYDASNLEQPSLIVLDHVLGPCGCVLTKESATFWTRINLPFEKKKHYCPFCATRIEFVRKLYFA